MKIIAIGGGEIGRPGYPIETRKIDKEIISLTGKKHPRLLFIPTASSDSESYFEVVQKYFGKKLGCKTDVLYIIKDKLTERQIKEKIFSSDIIYVGGGSTAKLMKVWRKKGVDRILKEASKKGLILSGVSAGAICWFKYGLSDSRRLNNPKAGLFRISGFGLINALYCPHYDIEPYRKPWLKKIMKKTPGVAVAVENCCAVEIINDLYRIISSKKNARAYKVYWDKGKFHEEIIPQNKKLEPLIELLAR